MMMITMVFSTGVLGSGGGCGYGFGFGYAPRLLHRAEGAAATVGDLAGECTV
jgi:hypothetical protein